RPARSAALVPPEPAKRVRKDRPHVGVAVVALPLLEVDVVSRPFEGLRERHVRKPPVPRDVVLIVLPVLEVDADRLARRPADENLVVVASVVAGLARLEVHEA